MNFFDRGTEIDKTPQLESVLTQQVRDEIAVGRLPVIKTDNIRLNMAENCRYVEQAIYEKKVRVPRGSARHSRKSGLFRSRQAEPAASKKADSVVDITFERIRGYLYITDSRVIFSSHTDNWQRHISDLLAVKPYLNCIKLQFGKESFKVFVPDGSVAQNVLKILRERHERWK